MYLNLRMMIRLKLHPNCRRELTTPSSNMILVRHVAVIMIAAKLFRSSFGSVHGALIL